MSHARQGRPGLLQGLAAPCVLTGTPLLTARALGASADDLVSRLAQLARLRDAGVLTEPEFQRAKTELLAG